MPLPLIQIQPVDFLQQPDFAIDPDPNETCLARRLENVLMLPLLAPHLGRQQRNPAPLRQRHYRIHNLRNRLPRHRTAAPRAMRHPHPGEQQPQIIVNLRNRPHRRPRVMRNPLLVNGNRRRKPLDVIHIRLIHPPQKLPRIRRQRLHIPPLPLGVNRIESQRTLARTRYPGNHHQPVARQRNLHILKIMLPGALDVYQLLRHCLIILPARKSRPILPSQAPDSTPTAPAIPPSQPRPPPMRTIPPPMRYNRPTRPRRRDARNGPIRLPQLRHRV